MDRTVENPAKKPMSIDKGKQAEAIVWELSQIRKVLVEVRDESRLASARVKTISIVVVVFAVLWVIGTLIGSVAAV